MAKTVTLTVQVDDAQFQAFTRNFDAFVLRIQSLTTSFQTIQTSITGTTKSAQTLNTTLSSLITSSNRLHSSITGITHQFGRWATLIGSTVMMLGGGVGMFGLDRLLNQFIQRQRQALGMGAGIGAAGAAAGAGPLFPGSPERSIAAIANARLNIADPVNTALRALGLDPSSPEFKRRTNEQNYIEAAKRFPGWLRSQKPGTELLVGEPIGMTKLFSEDEFRGLRAPGGERAFNKRLQLFQDLEKIKVTPEDQEKLDDLYGKWTIFKKTFETDLLSMVADLKPFLSMTADVTGALLGSGKESWGVAKKGSLWDTILYMLDPGLYNLFKGDKADDPVGGFKKNMDELNKSTEKIVNSLNEQWTWWERFKRLFGFGSSDATGPGGPGGNTQSEVDSAKAPDSTSSPIPGWAPRPEKGPLSSDIKPPFEIKPPIVTPVPSTAGPIPGWAPAPSPTRSFKDRSFDIFNEPTSQPKSPGFTLPPIDLPSIPAQPGPPATFKDRFGPFGARTQLALSRAAPGQGGIGRLLAQHTQSIMDGMSGPGGPLARSGPLDMDNYQMGRTASIHVHNEHPSVRMEIAGMS